MKCSQYVFQFFFSWLFKNVKKGIYMKYVRDVKHFLADEQAKV